MSDSIVRIHTTTAAQTEQFYCRFGKDGADRCFFIFSRKTDGLIGLLPLCPDANRSTPTYAQALSNAVSVMQALDRLCSPGAFLFAEELAAAITVDDDFEEYLSTDQHLIPNHIGSHSSSVQENRLPSDIGCDSLTSSLTDGGNP